MQTQEEQLLKIEKQVGETQAGLAHQALKNEAMESKVEAVQSNSEALLGQQFEKMEKKLSRRLQEKNSQIVGSAAKEADAKIEAAVGRINQTEANIR